MKQLTVTIGSIAILLAACSPTAPIGTPAPASGSAPGSAPVAASAAAPTAKSIKVALPGFENNLTPFTLTFGSFPNTHDMINLVYDTLFWSQNDENPEQIGRAHV